ncbi:MAG TPA: AP endonuclease [Gammaproteobacteria bacterium]|nr:AP endonuclease [Gammaproteobacteria bacterium]
MAWKADELAYCTNVHPGESAGDIAANLDRYVGPVKNLAQTASLSAGLWISHEASQSLQADGQRQRLKQCLVDNQLQLYTLNGFPFGGFHREVIKEAVYRPDWSDPKRLDYTVSLATILADCLPEGRCEGTISTLPLGFKGDWTPAKHRAAITHLMRLVKRLEALEAATGKHILVCLEMEPACVLEFTPEIITLFKRDLSAASGQHGIDEATLLRYLGVCFDVCHQAVMFEDAADALMRIYRAGITIGKMQLSSALMIRDVDAGSLKAQLRDFAEPSYLHQTAVRSTDGTIRRFTDLPQALSEMPEAMGQEWRIHYHVPVQLAQINETGLQTTQFALDDVFAFLAAHPSVRPHMEVETYTWQVLPEALRPTDDASLVSVIDTELQFIRDKLAQYGLLATDYHVGKTDSAHRSD